VTPAQRLVLRALADADGPERRRAILRHRPGVARALRKLGLVTAGGEFTPAAIRLVEGNDSTEK
jgi:hypothetical protein